MEFLLLLGVYLLIGITLALAIGATLLCCITVRATLGENGARRIIFAAIAVALAGVTVFGFYGTSRLLPMVR